MDSIKDQNLELVDKHKNNIYYKTKTQHSN